MQSTHNRGNKIDFIICLKNTPITIDNKIKFMSDHNLLVSKLENIKETR
jgi:hypothetical protein